MTLTGMSPGGTATGDRAGSGIPPLKVAGHPVASEPSGGGTDVTSLLTFAQRSLFKLGDDIADLFLPSAVDRGAVRPAAIPGLAASGAAARWMDQECFRTQTTRPPVNDNRPPERGIGPILVDDEIGFSALPFDRLERASNVVLAVARISPGTGEFPRKGRDRER